MSWLLANLQYLPVPADVAVGRGEQFLDAASGDPWAEAAVILPLSLLYSRAGRFADARAAIARGQSLYSGLGAKIIPCALLAGDVELMAGDLPAAERELKKGCEALRAMGERGFLSSSYLGSPRRSTSRAA